MIILFTTQHNDNIVFVTFKVLQFDDFMSLQKVKINKQVIYISLLDEKNTVSVGLSYNSTDPANRTIILLVSLDIPHVDIMSRSL